MLNRDKMIEMLSEKVKEKGRILTTREIDDEEDLFSHATVYEYFENMGELWNEIGVEYSYNKTKEEMLDELDSVIKELGYVPKTKDFSKYGLKCYTRYRDYIGGIRELCELLGYDYDNLVMERRNKRYEKKRDELIELLVERIENKKSINITDLREDKRNGNFKCSVKLYYNYFQSFKKAKKLAMNRFLEKVL